jgi:pantothenate kinase
VTADLDALVGRAIALCRRGRAVLGITGCPGSGKSTFAEQLVAGLSGRLADGPGAVAHVPMDGFHLADRELVRLGLRARKGTPETFDAEGYTALLRRLRDETTATVYAPAFERELEQPLAGAIPVGAGVRLVVTEGNYLLLDGRWAPVRPLLAEVWFVDVDEETRVRRLVGRHERFGKTRQEAEAWVRTVDGPNADLVRPTRGRADLVVDLDQLAGQPSRSST